MRQEILCVVGTDKASFDIEAPADGVLLKTLYNEGSDVQVRKAYSPIGKGCKKLRRHQGSETYP